VRVFLPGDPGGKGLLLLLALGLLAPVLSAAGRLVWADEFDGAPGGGPDPARWTPELGNRHGWGNNELEVYTDRRENVAIVADPEAGDGRALAIRALRLPDGTFTSARLQTGGKFAVRYGRVEARMKLPRDRGLWPAFWMLGAQPPRWPACGEIDIMEAVGHRLGTVLGTLHGPGYSGDFGLQGVAAVPAEHSFWREYHVFAVDWSPGRVEWSLDGRTYFVCRASDVPPGTRWVFDDGPFCLILNLAVGGNLPGPPDGTTVFPEEMRIDYVRVYAPETTATIPGH
jgi:beta-glucanase (GH16 family)